jgi:PhnB protein
MWHYNICRTTASHKGNQQLNPSPDGSSVEDGFGEDVDHLIKFITSVFDAHGQRRTGVPSELRIGDSLIMVSDGGGIRNARPGFLYVYVENTDETYQRAIDAGALMIEEPVDMPYGDRRAMVQDPWGNLWQIATHRAPIG